MKAVYLKPRGSFKADRITSDTLFGALCWGIRHLHGRNTLEDILSQFKEGTPPFLLTSTYPYQDNGSKTHYLPRPKTQPLRITPESREEIEKLKNLKKINFLPLELFERYAEGRLTDQDLYDAINTKGTAPTYSHNGKKYTLRDDALVENGALFTRKEIPRNAINRLNNATEGNLFYNRETFLSKDAGLYFLLDAKDTKTIASALGFLNDRGIGGDISVGKGSFEITAPQDFSLQVTDGDAFTTLSLYHPTKTELTHFSQNKNRTWYTLERRKGKIESSFVQVDNVWKDTTYMFTEGSVFPTIDNQEAYGKNPIVKETPFEVQQYGYAFPINIKTQRGD